MLNYVPAVPSSTRIRIYHPDSRGLGQMVCPLQCEISLFQKSNSCEASGDEVNLWHQLPFNSRWHTGPWSLAW